MKKQKQYILSYTGEQEQGVQQFIEECLGEVYTSFPYLAQAGLVLYSTTTRNEHIDVAARLDAMVERDELVSYTCKKIEVDANTRFLRRGKS